MALLRIDVYSHNFCVSDITPSARYYVEGYSRKWTQYGFIKEAGRWIRQAIKIFASFTRDRRVIRFHINQLTSFLQHLEQNNVDPSQIEIIRHPIYAPVKVDLPVFDKWSPRDYQVPVIEYITENEFKIGSSDLPDRSRFVALQTGKGKSYIAMQSASNLGNRVLIIVRPKYMDKWQEDITKTFDIDFQDMLVVRGSSSLIGVMELAKEGDLDAKVILISNKTLLPYFKLYEQFQESIRDLGYSVMPYELCERLGIGTLIMDEIHQDFHLNHKILTYTHVPLLIALSATLISDDDFVSKIYESTFPTLSRYQGEPYHKYVTATALHFNVQYPNKLRCQDYSRKTYSHSMFEESICRNKFLQDNYLEMIARTVEEHYLSEDYEKGDRCLVYCARIDFCTKVAEYLKKRFPDKDVRRYVEDDSYEDIMTADITVSTVGSAGTGLDIPMLTTVIMTLAINSSSSNIQGLGRLRDLVTKKTKFVYFVCDGVPKHLEYHERKRALLRDRALHYNERHYPRTL